MATRRRAIPGSKGLAVFKGALVTLITGLKTPNMARDFKQSFAEIDELNEWGYVKINGKTGVHPNLAAEIERRLAAFEPTPADVQDVIGQVILRMK